MPPRPKYLFQVAHVCTGPSCVRLLSELPKLVFRDQILFINTWRAKLLKCDWLMRRAFFLNSGQKLLDPDWLRRFILSIRTKYQKYT